MASNENICVGVRFRGLTPAECDRGEKDVWELDETASLVHPSDEFPTSNGKPLPSFRFNHVFGAEATNQQVFNALVKDIVGSAMRGVNGWFIHVFINIWIHSMIHHAKYGDL